MASTAKVLSQRFAGRPIAVAVEQSRGALVFLLSKYELHIFPVPPAMTANLRTAFYSSRAKNGPRDPDLLLDLLQRHREKLRRSTGFESPKQTSWGRLRGPSLVGSGIYRQESAADAAGKPAALGRTNLH